MYSVSVTSIALVAAFGDDAERRRHAQETLKILVRHQPKQTGSERKTAKEVQSADETAKAALAFGSVRCTLVPVLGSARKRVD
jgi:hypothetical protein